MAALAETVVVAVYAVVISLQASACEEPLDPDAVASAQRQLLLVVAVGVFPWLLAAVPIRRRRRLLVAAVVCVTPAVYSWSAGNWNPEWTYGGCLITF